MQFYDEVKIHIESGKWGNGLASGRREAWTPFWWPDGWDWWKWGDVIFVASKDENTLLPYRYRKSFEANNWENGRTKDQYWSNWENLKLVVPVWTLIKDDEWKILYQFTKDKEEWTALKWWEGGKGNIHFKNSINQFPNFAILWEPWDQKEITLELQLLADVALIWNPSVWKSSLINSISHTKAKVASYPFTTIVPNLGSISVWDYHFNMVDIPWIIQWAAEWKWLWNDFLRHVLKARIFCFVMDIDRFEKWMDETINLFSEITKYISNKIWKKIKTIIHKKSNYINLESRLDWELILDKKIIFAVNKYDLINDKEIEKEYRKEFLKKLNKFLKKRFDETIEKNILDKSYFVLSAATHYGLDDWKKWMLELLKNTKIKEVAIQKDIDNEFEEWEIEMVKDITQTEKTKLLQLWYLEEMDSKYVKVWEINNPEFCKLVFTLPWWNHEAELWFWKMAEEKWFIHEFERNWIRKWDVLKVISHYEWNENKYILY